MKTYWDLTERERAGLTSEQVEAFVDAELMSKGVLKPTPLALLPVPEAPEPDAQLFTLARVSHYDCIYFRTQEEAATVAGMTVSCERKRLGDRYDGPSVMVLGADKPERLVEVKNVYTAATYSAALDVIARAAIAADENKKRTEQHDKEVEAQRAALASMWADWHECGSKAHRLQRVRDTFADYLKMCDGNERIAAQFLAKAFPQPVIQDAREWFEIEIPEADAPQPVAPSSNVAADRLDEQPF